MRVANASWQSSRRSSGRCYLEVSRDSSVQCGALIGGFLASALDLGEIDEFFDLKTWLMAIGGSTLLLLIVRTGRALTQEGSPTWGLDRLLACVGGLATPRGQAIRVEP